MKRLRQYVLHGSIYGKLMLLIGLLSGVPLIVLPFVSAEAKYIPAFLFPMLFSLALGYIICVKTHRQKEIIKKAWQSPLQHGSLPVLFVWGYSFLMGALPLIISGRVGFVAAIFESVSSWTTAGLTVLDVQTMPQIFLFHRSFMQYCGGLGFIVMMAIVIQGKHSMSLFNAEGHRERLMPSLRRTSRTILKMYVGFLAAGILLYWLFGMSPFDAVCHAMTAISTAGFTTKSGSIGEYSSLSIELITILLMLAGASNFAILLSLTEGKIRNIFRITEMKFMIGILSVFIFLSTCSLAVNMNMGIGESLRQATFGVVSILSTTGYSTMDYSTWPPFALGLIMLLMIIGGSTGSTAGGIKLSRTYLLLRITRENIRKSVSPKNKITFPTFNTARGKMPVDESLIMETFGFIACYMGILVIGTLLITLTAGCSLSVAMFEFASALGTVGLSNGLTNADTNTATLIVEMAGMILGRLEIFVVFFGLGSAVRLVKQRLAKAPQHS